jgi:hypothetical protein
MQPRQEFLVYEPKLLVEGGLLENLFNQQFLMLNKKFMVRNSVGAACGRPERERVRGSAVGTAACLEKGKKCVCFCYCPVCCACMTLAGSSTHLSRRGP